MPNSKLVDAAEAVVIELKRILAAPPNRLAAMRNNINEAVFTLERALLDTDEIETHNPDPKPLPEGRESSGMGILNGG